jgi:hypothetical protein
MSKIRIFALGGLDEDGKNMYVVENNEDIFVMECGLKYPDGDQLGIEMIIPDFRYLRENQSRIKAIFITHGHEDVNGSTTKPIKRNSGYSGVYSTINSDDLRTQTKESGY